MLGPTKNHKTEKIKKLKNEKTLGTHLKHLSLEKKKEQIDQPITSVHWKKKN